MVEFLFELLFELAGVLAEALVELGAGEAFAAVTRAALGIRQRTLNSAVATVGYFFFGLGAGWLSVLALPHPLVRPARIHGLSLIVSPVLTGMAMSSVGKALRRRRKRAARIESFGYGFAFALGMALIRFLFVKPS